MKGDGAQILTVPEAAAYLRISRDHAPELIARGELPHIRLGRVIRVPRLGLEQWIARQAGVPLKAPVEVTSWAKPQGH